MATKPEVPFYDLSSDQLGYLRNLYQAVKAQGREIIDDGFTFVNEQLAGRDFVADHFGLADAALFYVEFWAERTGIPLPEHGATHYQGLCQRQAVRQVLREEGDTVAQTP